VHGVDATGRLLSAQAAQGEVAGFFASARPALAADQQRLGQQFGHRIAADAFRSASVAGELYAPVIAASTLSRAAAEDFGEGKTPACLAASSMAALAASAPGVCADGDWIRAHIVTPAAVRNSNFVGTAFILFPFGFREGSIQSMAQICWTGR